MSVSAAASPPRTPPAGRPAKPGPWYRWHPATYLLLAALAGAMLYANLRNLEPVDDLRLATVTAWGRRFALDGWTYGWPALYSEGWQQTVTPLKPPGRPRVALRDSQFHAPGLVANLVAALLLLGSAAWVSERWHRRTALQFRLRHLFLLTALLAVALSICRAWPLEQISQWSGAELGHEDFVSRMFRFPPYVYVTLLLGLTCLLCVAFRAIDLLLSGCLLRALHLLRRRQPRRPRPSSPRAARTKVDGSGTV